MEKQIEQLVAACEDLKKKEVPQEDKESNIKNFVKTTVEFADYDEVFYDSSKIQFEIEQQIMVKNFALGTMINANQFNIHYETEDKIKDTLATFHHGKSPPYVDVIFTLANRDCSKQTYKLTAKYTAFQSVIMQPSRKDFVVFIKMINPFLMYRLEEERQNVGQCWLRAHEISSHSKVNIGKCNVMKLVFNTYPRKLSSPLTVINSLKFYTDHISPLAFKLGNVYTIHANPRSYYLLPEAAFFKTGFIDLAIKNFRHIPPMVLQAALGLFTVSYQFEDEVNYFLKSMKMNLNANEYFYELLQKVCDDGGTKALEEALHDVFLVIDNNDDNDGLMAYLYERLNYYSTHDVDRSIKGVTYVHRVVLTPTRILLMPPHPFVESRFLRDCETDYAMRMIIKDDNDDQVTFTICSTGSTIGQRTLLDERIKPILDRGIRIGRRIYMFLGCSSSQMRDHGCVLYARDSQGRTAADMLDNIGDLSNITAVPKFMARVGLAFSQAMGYITIDPSQVVHIPDVMGGKNPMNGEAYCFSDGVGMISYQMARKVCEMLKLDNIPSAYQIRYKGCKGLVVINPKIPGNKLFLRESMIKFKESTSVTLEILKYSKNRQVYLNRPLISLLDQLGTSSDVIIKMQLKAIEKLSKSFLSSDKAGLTIKQLSPLVNSIIFVDKLRDAKVDLLKEPFFRRSLDLLIKRAMQLLKEKARIPISQEKGRIMFGAMDDFNVLKYNQIFVQVSHDKKSSQVITGKVLITKYPCMHPGDVRIMDAIDDPRLHHLTDVLIFSATGHRPNPDEMAGSDLDGDEYTVIWDPELFFTGKNHDPMHFPINKADPLGREVRVPDMTKFFIKFIQGYNVGVIANTHLAMVDRVKDGIFSETALNLCEKYATALDFPKTGHSVFLSAKDRALIYPDFMMKSDEKPTYRSDRVLGKLYRQICLFEDCFDEDASDEMGSSSSNWDQFIHPDAKLYTSDAVKAQVEYAADIDSLVRRFGVTECALLCNVVHNSSKHFTGKKDLNDVQDLIELMVQSMFEKHRKKFMSSDGGDLTEEQLMAKASAYYIASTTINIHQRQKQNGRVLYGFPWIASEYLALLATRKVDRPQNHDFEFHELSSRIEEQFSNQTVQQILTNRWLPAELHGKQAIRDKLEAIVTLVQTQSPAASKESHIRAVLQHYIDDLFSQGQIVTDSDSKLMGFHSLSTLNKLLRTANPDHLLSIGTNKMASRRKLRSFCVAVFRHDFKHLVSDPARLSQLANFLKKKCSLDRLILKVYQTKGDEFMRISALGHHAHLLKLEEYIQQPMFYSTVVKDVTGNNGTSWRYRPPAPALVSLFKV